MARWPNTEQKEVTFARIGYEPNPVQWPVHRSREMVRQVVGAEGGGKSYVAACEAAALVPWCDLIYLIGQTYINAAVEFNYLVEFLQKLGALDMESVSRPKQGSWIMVTRTGCQIETLSVERGAGSIIARGAQPDLFILCEAGVISSFSVLLASVRRATRVRGWVLLVGTLKDNFGWYASLTEELAAEGNLWNGETFSLPAWSNLVLYPGGRDDPEIKRLESILPEDEFKRTVAAEKSPSRALVFGGYFSYGANVRACPYDPDLPVWLWIDPGYYPSAYAVLAVQFQGREVWQIDEVYLHQHVHEQVIGEVRKREWWGNVNRLVMDVAGKQHHASKSAFEVWQGLTGMSPVGESVGIADGILRHRSFLKGPNGPRLFHDPRCKETLGEYRRYRLPSDRDGNPTSDIPKDVDNHAMKALVYGLVDRFGLVDAVKAESVVMAQGIEKGVSEWA